MTYQTVYDITENTSVLSSVRLISTFFLLVVIITFTTIFLKNNQYKHILSNKATRKLIIGGLLIAVPLSLIISMTILLNSDLHTAIRGGNYKTVEGLVVNFNPMPEEGHKQESFDVGGVHFEYSDYSLAIQGYHNAASHGGAIQQGLQVRIKYHESNSKNEIIKLEVQAPN